MSKHKWTESEKEYVAKHYPDVRTGNIANELGLTLAQVYSMARRLELKKSQAFLDSEESGRLRGEHGQCTRFKPGQVSWNKGKNYVAGGRSQETRFKKGNKPLNWKPVGSYRVNGDGYLDLKVNDLPGHNNVRWHSVHRLIWIEANGAIPENHMIIFKPGMRTNVLEEITLNTFECISRTENALRNQPYARGQEFGDLVRIKSAITRHVNRITKEHNEVTQ